MSDLEPDEIPQRAVVRKMYHAFVADQPVERGHEKHVLDTITLHYGRKMAYDIFTEPTQAQKAEWERQIKRRTHDQLTGRRILERERLIHGRYYKGRCRNATVARWNAEAGCFFHWREKFGRIFIETIRYPTDEVEPWWDTFAVVEDFENPKFMIPFDREAEFTGNREDLYEHNAEMWSEDKTGEADADPKRGDTDAD